MNFDDKNEVFTRRQQDSLCNQHLVAPPAVTQAHQTADIWYDIR